MVRCPTLWVGSRWLDGHMCCLGVSLGRLSSCYSVCVAGIQVAKCYQGDTMGVFNNAQIQQSAPCSLQWPDVAIPEDFRRASTFSQHFLASCIRSQSRRTSTGSWTRLTPSGAEKKADLWHGIKPCELSDIVLARLRDANGNGNEREVAKRMRLLLRKDLAHSSCLWNCTP